MEDTPNGRFSAAEWVWAFRGSIPGGTVMGQSHMGSINTPNVSLVTPFMLSILDAWQKRGRTKIKG
jgi:hypothetical protein